MVSHSNILDTDEDYISEIEPAGPPSYGKSTSLLALTRKLDTSLETTAEIVKRWSNEVQEAIQSRSTQFHALALLHQLSTAVKDVLSELAEVGPSIMLASLSEVLAFVVGSFIPMPACRKISTTNKHNRACNEVPPTVGTKSFARRIHMGSEDYDTEDYEDYVEAQDDF
ncbi:coatomer subunit gamma [Tanacetum coccineum]